MNAEQQQAIDLLAGDNSRLSDFDRDALRALLEDCGRAEGLVDYWRTQTDDANSRYRFVTAERDALAAQLAQVQRELAEIQRDLA